MFDALAGPDAGELIRLLPDQAVIYNHGKLTGKPIDVDSLELISKLKVIRGYNLFADLFGDPQKAAKLFKGAFEKIAKGTFKWSVVSKFTQDKVEEALKVSTEVASKGKVLIQNPNFGR